MRNSLLFILTEYMFGIGFDPYCADGPDRAEILAGSAARAPVLEYRRNLQRGFVVGIQGDHHYGSRRAVAGAVAAADPIADRQAVVPVPYGPAYAHCRFLFASQREYRPGGAEFAARRAFRAAPAFLIRRIRLHKVLRVKRRAKNPVGAV